MLVCIGRHDIRFERIVDHEAAGNGNAAFGYRQPAADISERVDIIVDRDIGREDTLRGPQILVAGWMDAEVGKHCRALLRFKTDIVARADQHECPFDEAMKAGAPPMLWLTAGGSTQHKRFGVIWQGCGTAVWSGSGSARPLGMSQIAPSDRQATVSINSIRNGMVTKNYLPKINILR
jgi:hypothetical protein